MRKKRLLVSIAFIILLATISILHTVGVTATGRRISFQTIGKELFLTHERSGYYVINDAAQWEDMLNQQRGGSIPQSSIPDIDFSKSTVIAVFLGSRNTLGYEIEVKEIIDTGLFVVVKVEKTYPSEDCLVLQMFSYPYHMVKTNKIDKHILFNTVSSVIQCG